MYSGEDKKEEAVLKYCRDNRISRNSQKALAFYNILDDEGKIVEDEIGIELGSKFQCDGEIEAEDYSKAAYEKLKNELEYAKWHSRETQSGNNDLKKENLMLKTTVSELQARLKAQTDSYNQLLSALHGSTNSYIELQEKLTVAEAKLARLGIANDKLHSEAIATAPNTALSSLSSSRSTAAVDKLSGEKSYFVTK